ncbi:MAG: ABC transporter permease [Reyranella sp.]|uniref:ABC transporter permease n=1 Tax=Reyranella sp. TaxID=1929291 RepID=UPI0025F819D4|nr:ABC transporter permease [Reyranella sp.]MBR2815494.1 ABC transporter permease [Reyranella sp.]
MAADRRGLGWLLASLALQNLGRRRARSFLLIAAVAVASGVVFTGATLMRSIDRSMEIGFTRMGADMMVAPEGALTNITAALLTVEPTDLVLDADLFAKAAIASVRRAAPQKIARVEHSGIGSHHESADLIGFDPALDFTIRPWLVEKLNRDLQPGDVILGAGRDAPLGSQLLIFGKPHIVYGRLGRTGVGTHERGVFMTFQTFDGLAAAMGGHAGHGGNGPLAVLQPGKVSGFLVELAPGAPPLQARFAILSSLKGIKVVTGDTTMSGIRQGLAALLDGILALTVLMFASMALMVSVLFSAIVTERRAELGLLKSIGARRSQIVGMMVIEAVIATGVGGALGVVLGFLAMRLYERSLVYYLENMGVPFAWLATPQVVAFALGAIALSSIIGALGALTPAWRASRRDPYDLVRGES